MLDCGRRLTILPLHRAGYAGGGSGRGSTAARFLPIFVSDQHRAVM
jgi:hypothetical protein